MAFMKTNYVDIIVGGTIYNSLSDFNLAINNTDYIGDPVLDEHYSFVPGRSGPLDYTNVFGGPSYKYREIKIQFGGIQESEDWDGWISNFRNLFHGKVIKLIFGNDPNWYYTGRCTVEEFSHNRALGTFYLCINYAYPYKLKDISETVTATGGGTTKQITVTEEPVIPEITCANNITIIENGVSYSFDAGTSKDPEFKLTAGTHTLVITGSGSVTIAYRDGSL